MGELTKGRYYAYVLLNTGEKYFYESWVGKDRSIKEVFDHLELSGKKEYAALSLDNCNVPLFYKHTGDMSLIQLDKILEKATIEGAKWICIIESDY